MATSIILTWNQNEGADAVDRYEINYTFTINECGVERVFSMESVIITANGSTYYRISIDSSSTTPVEEDSSYNISLTAINDVTRSNTVTTTTSTISAGT